MQLLGRNWLELFKPKDRMVNVIEVILIRLYRVQGTLSYLRVSLCMIGGRGGRGPLKIEIFYFTQTSTSHNFYLDFGALNRSSSLCMCLFVPIYRTSSIRFSP